MPQTKTDKMLIVELSLEESLKSYLRREYNQPNMSITALAEKLNKDTGLKIERSTIWNWLKFFKIRRKIWK